MVQVIRDWATAHPDEILAFHEQMKEDRKKQHAKNGLSTQGDMQRFGSIPMTLHNSMCKAFGRMWNEDLKLRSMFWDHFEVGKIYRYSDAPNR